MQRYFLTKEDYNENIIRSDDVFHIYKVMRNKPGDMIEVCYNNEGWIAKIIEVTNSYVTFEKVNKLKSEKNDVNITLIQGLAKGDKNEEIIKHSTELGVNRIILVSMKRSIVKISNDKLDSKLSRFEKIAKEAAEQAHRLSIPEIIIVNSFKNIGFNEFDLKILLDEEEAKKEDGLLLKGVSFVNMKNISFVIGPEGGIDDSERSLLIDNNFIPVSLGKNILRTETASLAFLAMIKYELMEV